MSSAFCRRLPLLLAALLLGASASYGQHTLIQTSVEPLPNCTPAPQGQLEPIIWDITAQQLKTCGPGSNQWSPVGTTTPGLFASFQFGTNPAITSGANYFQLAAGSNVTFSYAGSGTLASPFVATINAANTSSVAFSALTPGTNTSLGGFIFATTSTTTVPLTVLSPVSMTADVFDVCSNSAGACGTKYFDIASTGTAAFAAVPNFPSQTANQFFAAPNGSPGIPSFRFIVAADIPTLNQNTTGTAGGLTGSPAITVSSIIDSGLTIGTSPVCPNGTGGALTTTGCSGGGGGTPASPAFSLQVNNAGAFGSVTPPSDTQVYTLTGSTGQFPVWALPGIVPSACNTTNSYSIQSSDRGKFLCQSGSTAGSWTLPQAGSTGFNGNWYVTIANETSLSMNVTATTSTFAPSFFSVGSILTINPGYVCYIQSNNSNYQAYPCVPLAIVAGSGISFTSTFNGLSISANIPVFEVNGTNLSNQSPVVFVNGNPTNGLTLTFSNPSAGNVQLGFTGTLNDAGLTDAYSGAGSCPANEYENADNRDTAPTCDFAHNLYDSNGLSTILSSATASAVDQLTVKNAATGNPATLTISATGTDANININLVSKGTGTVECNGSTCSGGGSGPTLETNGVSNTSQTVLNFITSTTNTTGLTITPSNPATGNEKFEITGTVNAANIANIPLQQVISPTSQPAAFVMTGDTLEFDWGATNQNKLSFDSSGNPLFGLVSFTTAVTNSPTLTLAGSYQNSGTPTFAEDGWQLEDLVGSGTNGTSTLVLSHIGTTGTLGLTLPASLTVTANTLTISSTTGGFTWNGPSSSIFTNSSSGGYTLTVASGQNLSATIGGSTGQFKFVGSGTAADQFVLFKYGTSSPTAPAIELQSSTAVDEWDVKNGVFATYNSLALVGNGVPTELFNTASAAVTGNISSTQMLASSAAATTGYRATFYVTQTVVGTSCVGNTTVAVNLIYQDPNAASAQTVTVGTFTVTTNGTIGIVPLTSGAAEIPFEAKTSTAISYSATYTAGGSCSPAPTIQVYPHLWVE